MKGLWFQASNWTCFCMFLRAIRDFKMEELNDNVWGLGDNFQSSVTDDMEEGCRHGGVMKVRP